MLKYVTVDWGKMNNNIKQKFQMENNNPLSVYKSLKQRAPESLTAKELSEAIKQDIRCIALIPEGMQVEGIPELSKQEIDDIKFICSENRTDEEEDDFMINKFDTLPLERRTKAVSQAAILNDSLNLQRTPENIWSDDFLLWALRNDGRMLGHVNMERRTPEMYMTALENTGKALKYFPKEMITPEIAMRAVENTGWALEYVPDEIKTPEMCRKALNDKNSEFMVANVIGYVPFPDVCLEYMKTINPKKENPYAVFSEIRPDIITPEMALLAIKLESESIRLVPERIKTPEMCMEAVEKKWFNIRFVPEEMKTKELCETAMKDCVFSQYYIPEELKTPEMFIHSVKADGMSLSFVPERYCTPEVCLQAVISNPEAKQFVPFFTEDYNILGFYGKLQDELFGARQLSFEQIQKLFAGETILVSGMYFANVKLKDFNLDYDRKTNRIIMKTLDEIPEKKQENKRNYISQPEKRRKIKM